MTSVTEKLVTKKIQNSRSVCSWLRNKHNHESWAKRVLEVVIAYGIDLREENLKILRKSKHSLAQGFEPSIF